MLLDARQRKMVRLAFRCKDADLRRAAVKHLRLALREGSSASQPAVRLAKYVPEFMKAVEGKKFHNPNTGNQVKFVSLPAAEQKKVYEQWAASRQQEPKPTALHPLQDVMPDTDAVEAAQGIIKGLFPAQPGSFDELRKLHEAGKPWHLPAVRGGKQTGSAFWEARGDGDKIEVRFGPVGSWSQAKPLKSIEEAWKRYRSKLNGPKGYMTAGPSLAMSFGPGPVGLDADKLWKQIEAEHGSDPKKMTEVLSATLTYLGHLDKDSKGKWGSIQPAIQGLRKRWEKAQQRPKTAPKPGKPKSPEMTDMTSEVMQAITQTGPHPKPKKDAPKKGPPGGAKKIKHESFKDLKVGQRLYVFDKEVGVGRNVKITENDGGHLVFHDEDTKPTPSNQRHLWPHQLGYEVYELPDEEAPAQKKTEPKKTEPKKTEPKKPGKHKNRKELRARPTKKMSDKVEVSDDLKALILPEGVPQAKREMALKQLEVATYGLLAMLRDNTAKAVKDPKGNIMEGLRQGGYTLESAKKMLSALNGILQDAEGRKYHPDVLAMANKYDLESEDADELRDFKGNKPHKGRPLSPVELMQKFLAKANPETRERMQGMSVDDFMVMYKAIMADEEEEDVEAPAKKASRLPQQPHAEVSKAVEDGRLGGGEEGAPKKRKKNLTAEDRKIVRLAHATDDRRLRREILALLDL